MYALHPKLVKYQRFWERSARRRERRAPGVLTSSDPLATRPVWSDYFPWAMGTVPEKMIFAELMRRGVSFFFGAYWGDVPFTDDKYERYRPDFILPEYRIIIEIYGTYWHTKEESAQRDARKAIMYTASGYKYYHLWDFDIFASAVDALNTIPELVNPAIKTGQVYVSDRPFDPTASLRAARQGHPKVIRLRTTKSRTRLTGLSMKAIRLRAAKKTPPLRSAFQGLDTAHLAELKGYWHNWQGYMKRLKSYFEGSPQVQQAYPKEYEYYLRWQDYEDRWQQLMLKPAHWANYIQSLGDYFSKYPGARGAFATEYYRWLTWRRMGYRRL